jgi:dihydroxyacetone kinase phosphotransfer subunit
VSWRASTAFSLELSLLPEPEPVTVGIVLVSHSAQLANGVKELAEGMVAGAVKIAAAGGGPEGSLGTSAEAIEAAIETVYDPDGVLVLVDLGSAVMSAEVAIESLPPEQAAQVLISNAPLVEGAVIASVEASIGKGLRDVEAAAVQAASMPKVER